MYKIRRTFSLKKASHNTLLEVLENNLRNYNFEKKEDTIYFRYCKRSYGIFFNSFLLKGEIDFLNNGDILCQCELFESVKKGFYGLNFVLLLFLLPAIIRTPEILGVLSVTLFLCFIGINLFAYVGLFISSAIFYGQIRKTI